MSSFCVLHDEHVASFEDWRTSSCATAPRRLTMQMAEVVADQERHKHYTWLAQTTNQSNEQTDLGHAP